MQYFFYYFHSIALVLLKISSLTAESRTIIRNNSLVPPDLEAAFSCPHAEKLYIISSAYRTGPCKAHSSQRCDIMDQMF